MSRHGTLALITTALLTGGLLAAAWPAGAAEVTPERLANADKEPQNWLMNHRSYDSQRYSPLDKINTVNVKSLRLAYAVAIGGTAINENLESTPLAEDGFLYVVDQWGVLYKIDARSGDAGRIVWRMDPKGEKAPDANRGAALWGNFVVTIASFPPRVIATNKDNGQIAWETNLGDGQAGLEFTAAPLAVKDKIILGASGGD
jgi:alcohol dehydrogenase (cytochrome c)